MEDIIQTSIGTVGKAADVLISQGVLGALVIIELAVIMLLGWLLWRTRNKYTDHLEEHLEEHFNAIGK